MRLLACLIVAPQRGYDEPAILSYAISSFCPTSADGLHFHDVAAVAPPAPSLFGETAQAVVAVVTRLSPRLSSSADAAATAARPASATFCIACCCIAGLLTLAGAAASRFALASSFARVWFTFFFG